MPWARCTQGGGGDTIYHPPHALCSTPCPPTLLHAPSHTSLPPCTHQPTHRCPRSSMSVRTSTSAAGSSSTDVQAALPDKVRQG